MNTHARQHTAHKVDEGNIASAGNGAKGVTTGPRDSISKSSCQRGHRFAGNSTDRYRGLGARLVVVDDDEADFRRLRRRCRRVRIGFKVRSPLKSSCHGDAVTAHLCAESKSDERMCISGNKKARDTRTKCAAKRKRIMCGKYGFITGSYISPGSCVAFRTSDGRFEAENTVELFPSGYLHQDDLLSSLLQPEPRPQKIDTLVIDGHVIPNHVLFTAPTPDNVQHPTLVFSENLKVTVSFLKAHNKGDNDRSSTILTS